MEKARQSLADINRISGSVIKQGLRVMKKHPKILAYPYLASAFVIVTFPTVNTFAFWAWNHFAHDGILSLANDTSNAVRIILGLVTFSFFYTTFVTAFFTTAISADVLEELDGKDPKLLHGLERVVPKFFRVTRFALLAVFFFPIAIFVQRRKIPTKGFIDVIGSSLSLSMAQLAPAILSSHKSVSETIRDSINTLGTYWKEGLLIKIGIYCAIFLIGLLGFIPKLIEQHWLDGDTAHILGWLATAMLWFSGYIFVKVIGNVFTSVLYHKAKTQKQN